MNLWLDKKYINLVAPYLTQFRWSKSHVATFRCPFCLDSQKSSTKTRGYVYSKEGSPFKMCCHNCGKTASLYYFLKQISPQLAREYRLEKYADSNTTTPQVSIEDTFTHKTPVFDHTNSLLDLLVRCDKLDSNHPACQYLTSRMIPADKWNLLYWCEDFPRWGVQVDPSQTKLTYQEGRLVIPFYLPDGTFFAASCRSMNPNSGLRYITLKVNDNDSPKIYGLERYDRSKRGYAVEGPIDSLFLPNCLAFAGLGRGSLPEAPVDYTNLTFVMDNEPRNREVVQTVESLITKGYRVCLLPPDIQGKDINEMVLAGVSIEDLQQVIYRYTFSGLTAKLNFAKWKKI